MPLSRGTGGGYGPRGYGPIRGTVPGDMVLLVWSGGLGQGTTPSPALDACENLVCGRLNRTVFQNISGEKTYCSIHQGLFILKYNHKGGKALGNNSRFVGSINLFIFKNWISLAYDQAVYGLHTSSKLR